MRERHRRRLGSKQAHDIRERLRILGGEPPLRDRRERRGAEPEEPIALRCEPLREPAGRLLHAPVLGEPPRKLLGGFLGLEVGELRSLVLEESPRLELEQRGDENEELAAGVEVERLPLREPLDEAHDDAGDVHVGQVDFLLQDERQQQVEGAFEGVEVQLELAHDHGADPSGPSGRALWARPWPVRWARPCSRAGARRPTACG